MHVMGENRKIKNTKEVVFDNIKFKSQLERSCYKKIKETDLDVQYESEKIILWEGVKLDKVSLHAPKKIRAGKYEKDLQEQTRALLKITYTPDFIIIRGKHKIYIDVKGKENDVYPIKKKMFLKHLEEREDDYTYHFFEPHSVKQIMQTIQTIKDYEE